MEIYQKRTNSRIRGTSSAIKERFKFGDAELTELRSALKDIPFEERTEKVTWHRKRYQDTTHSVKESEREIRKGSSRARRIKEKIKC